MAGGEERSAGAETFAEEDVEDGDIAGSRLSLRTLSLVTTVAFGMLVTALVVGLLLASRMVWRSSMAAEEDIGAVAVTVEITHALREYHRLETLYAATEEPEVAEAATLVEADLRRLIAALGPYVESRDEERLLDDLDADVDRLLAGWTKVQAERRPLDERLRLLRPVVDEALAVSAALRNLKIEQLRVARAEAKRAIDVEVRVATLATFLLVVGLAIVVWGMRHVVLRPIFQLHAALRRFHAGDVEARAGDGRLVELRDLAEAFNQMAAAIARQRRDQLTFLAAVAHDLRSPLAVLKMGFQVVSQERGAVSPERLARFERQIDRLARMVGDLLDTARIEAGKLELQLADVDLREVVTAIADLYVPTCPGHEIVVVVPEWPVVVRGDALRIEQVVSNLLSNAIKYSPAGGRVDVALTVERGEARVAVRDRGLGIEAAQLGTLFQPFRRARATEALPGVGLGLSIVRRIVEAHGGRVEVKSALGAGSTFTVSLPLRPRVDERAAYGAERRADR